MPSENILLRRLGLKEATALVIGTVIGTGVFLKATKMSQVTGSPLWVILAWIVAGLLSLAGALCYAELGGLYPQAGGEYVYLREAYGEMAGFLYGWMRFWIGTPGSIAAYGVGAATFLGGIFQVNPEASSWMKNLAAIAMITGFSSLNTISVIVGGRLAAFMTALKIAMILGLTTALFLASKGSSWSHLQEVSGSGGWCGFSAFGTAMLAALWAYDGWNNMPMAAGEIKDPGKNIPRGLIYGMTTVLVIYVAINLSYFYVLPFSEVLSSYSSASPSAMPVATKAASLAFGSVAVVLLSSAFVFSALGSMNGSILTGARIPFAMARDGLFFHQLGRVTKKSRTPWVAILAQGAVASALALSGTFDQLTDYVVFASWIFYAMVTASIFVFRKRNPNAERPYRTPGYPMLPAVFLAASVLLLINTVISTPRESLIGLAFIISGIPVYFIFRRKQKQSLART